MSRQLAAAQQEKAEADQRAVKEKRLREDAESLIPKEDPMIKKEERSLHSQKHLGNGSSERREIARTKKKSNVRREELLKRLPLPVPTRADSTSRMEKKRF